MTHPTRSSVPVILTAAIALASLGSPTLVRAQESEQQSQQTIAARKQGTIFKREVDGAVRGLRLAASQGGNKSQPLGDGSPELTAKILTALGHCHRFYSMADGPVVRPSLALLFENRRNDGSFGTAAASPVDAQRTTAWVHDALQTIGPNAYAQEVKDTKAWLTAQGIASTPFTSRLDEARVQIANGTLPQDFGAEAADRLSGLLRGPALDHAAVTEELLTVVIAQMLNRELDNGGAVAKPAAAAPPWAKSQQRGFRFLLRKLDDGVVKIPTGGGSFADPGMTAMVLSALQTKPKSLRSKDEAKQLDQGLSWLLAQQNPDGSFGQQAVNYTTCAAVMALKTLDSIPVKAALQQAQRYILAIQNTEDTGYAQSDRDYGSIGYGSDERGDLSNLQFALEALRATGLDPEDEAFAKAIVFLQRTQNLEEVNDFKGMVRDGDGNRVEVTSGNDGGSAYYPGNSPAGYVTLPDGKQVPRSYGSMTYALLKSYTMAGLDKDDPRVKAAVKWISTNWTLAENPGADPELGEKVKFQGLFYYYMVLAQALDIAGIETVLPFGPFGDPLDPRQNPLFDGVPPINWRASLAKKLAMMQRPDGSWLNTENGRWFENLDTLCTAYAMVALHRVGSGTTKKTGTTPDKK